MNQGEEQEEIYRENILDHYKHPRNFGLLEPCSFQHREVNPLCGDEITLFVELEHGKVKDVKFTGKGCAISMASASLFTDKIKGMEIQQIKALTQDDIMEMLGISVSITRMRCATLPLKTLFKGVATWEEHT